jgi:hypothetical protein
LHKRYKLKFFMIMALRWLLLWYIFPLRHSRFVFNRHRHRWHFFRRSIILNNFIASISARSTLCVSLFAFRSDHKNLKFHSSWVNVLNVWFEMLRDFLWEFKMHVGIQNVTERFSLEIKINQIKCKNF